eukprot:1154888-Pelagomonas_calceolata.AAC.6
MEGNMRNDKQGCDPPDHKKGAKPVLLLHTIAQGPLPHLRPLLQYFTSTYNSCSHLQRVKAHHHHHTCSWKNILWQKKEKCMQIVRNTRCNTSPHGWNVSSAEDTLGLAGCLGKLSEGSFGVSTKSSFK